MVLNPTSQVNFNANQLSFVLDILDPDLDCHAVYISSQGKLKMMNISILATNADLKGIYCGFLNGVEINNLQIAGRFILCPYKTLFFFDKFQHFLKILWPLFMGLGDFNQ